MSNRLHRFLDWVWGTKALPPPAAVTPRPEETAVQAPQIEYRDTAQGRASSTPTDMRYHKERIHVPVQRASRWKRATPRQRFLVKLAGISLVAMLVAWAASFTGSKVLPAEIQGLYATDDTMYATRRFELRAHRVAFTTSDTIRAVTGLPIQQVRQSVDAHGIRYDVEYQDEGGSHQISFIVLEGAEPQIKFVNQPRLVWRRVSTGQTLMRQIY